MDMRKCLCMLVLCLVAGVMRRSDGVKIHKFEVRVASLEHAKQIAMIIERSGTYEQVLTIKYLQSAFCLGKQVILVVSTDDQKYFGDGVKLKDGERPEVKWTEDALGKLMSMVLEIKYYSYENEAEDTDVFDDGGAMSQKNSEEIVKVRFDKMKTGNISMDQLKESNVKGLDCDKLKDQCFKTRTMLDCNLYFICMAMQQNQSSEVNEKKGVKGRGVECKIMQELCRVEDDQYKKEVLCESAEKLCEEPNDASGLSDIACLIACLPKCILFGTDCVANCLQKCARK